MKTFFMKLSEFASYDKLAIVSHDSKLSYSDLKHRVILGAQYLIDKGLSSESIVGVEIKDELEHFIATLSLLLLGAKKITFASYDSSQFKSDLILKVSINHVLVSNLNDNNTSIKSILWLPNYSNHRQQDNNFSDDGIIFLRTSGTTAKPNILKFDQEQLALQSKRHQEYSNERLLRLASIEYNNSIRHRLYCTYMGGVNIFYNANKAPDLLDYIEKQRVTCLDVSMMHLHRLIELGPHKAFANVKVRTGGSSVSFELRQAVIQNVSKNLYVRYATSETGAISMAMPSEHDNETCSGKPLKGVQIKIVDANDQAVPQGHIGTIAVILPGMINSYYKNPEQSSLRFRNGWFYPGDMGYIREDKSIVVLGRQDEMIIMNGLNIFPKEIEAVLEQHPNVLEAVALGIESRIHGNIPVAAVILKKGCILNSNDLALWAKKILGLKSPRKIIFVQEFPRNSQNKIVRREIAMLFKA